MVRIFGSYAKDDQHKTGEVDIPVKIERPIGLKFFEFWDSLEKLFGSDVDLVRLTLLREERKDKIIKEAVSLWSVKKGLYGKARDRVIP